MTRKEQLERQYQQSREANGYGSPRKVLRDGPLGTNPFAKFLKRLMTLVVVAGLIGLAYRLVMSYLLVKANGGGAGFSQCIDEMSTAVSGGEAAYQLESKETGGKVSDAQLKEFLTPTDAEMVQLYGYVAQAPFVTENVQYRDRMRQVNFTYVATNDVVNAFSWRKAIEKDGKRGLEFHTVFFGGAARYARMVGLAAAVQDAGAKDFLTGFVANMPRTMCGRCDEASCIAFLRKAGIADSISDAAIRQRAISYSSGTIVSVIAHESGHHALGHMLSVNEKTNLEIDRNQEREADSFASSVISASPFGEYIFAGTLFWHYAIAMQSDDVDSGAADHPLSRERFENFVRANAAKAAAMGISLQ